MAVVQEAFYIPSDIMTKILTGEYRRIGGVVRYAVGPHKGQIVKHLKPVDMNGAENVRNLGAKLLPFIKKNKRTVLVAAIGTGALLAGGGIYYRYKTNEPKAMRRFRNALKEYLEAVRGGDLEVEKIDRLMSAIEELQSHKDYKKFSIQLSTEELEVLVNRLYDFTMKLAKDNDIELTEAEHVHSDNAIINLRDQLMIQRRIFETAA